MTLLSVLFSAGVGADCELGLSLTLLVFFRL